MTVKTAAQPRLRPIEGRHNPRVKELRQAFDSADLTADGYCAVEGMHLVEEAIRSGLRFRAVYFAESAQNRAQRLLPQIGAQVETLLLPDKLFAGAVPSGTPQGVAALVKVRVWTPSEVIARAKSVPLLLIAGLQDPGNLGTILRSAEAFGAAGVLLGEGTVSPFNSKVIRASAGSLFRVATAQAKLKPTILEIREAGIRVLATSSHKGTPLPETKLNGAFAVLIGGEGAGVPRDLLSEVDEVIAIPHAPQVESLNAGVAASIVMYEAARQRTQ